MKVRALLSWLAIFGVSLLITVSCTPAKTSTSNSSSAPATAQAISMGYSAWPGWIPWQVAAELKLFDANKVNVELKWFDSYTDSITGLTTGQLMANAQTLNDTLSSVAAGSNQVIVLVNDNSTGNDQIIVRQGINTIADLKGKKVAVEQGTVDHFLLLLGLEKAGLTEKDIEFQPLETGAAAAAFVAERVDAVGVFAPFTTQALKRSGSKALFTSKDFPGAIPDHLAVSRDLIDQRPQDVQALVNSWFSTRDYIQKNPDKSYQIMAKRAGVSVEEYKQYDSGTKIFSVEENLEAFRPGKDMKHLPYAAEEISQFLSQTGLIKKQPKLDQLFDDRFIKAYAASRKNA